MDIRGYVESNARAFIDDLEASAYLWPELAAADLR
jgi:hypothetical protein